MSTVLSAIAPVFLIIAAGWALRASGIAPRDQWGGVNVLAYWILFPAFLFSGTAKADFSIISVGPFFTAVIGGFATMAVLTIGLRPFLAKTPGPTFTSVVQGGVRWNGVIAVAIAEPLLGPEGSALALLIFAPTVPFVNMVSVAALSRWGEKASPSPRVFFARLATNPLILACLFGGLANVTGLVPTGPVDATLDLMSAAAIPISLLGIGAGIDLASLRGQRGALFVAVALKLIAAPIAMGLWALSLGLPSLAVTVLVLAGATPGAASSYVLARELGGDAPLTAAHVSATTMLSAITIPFWIAIATAYP